MVFESPRCEPGVNDTALKAILVNDKLKEKYGKLNSAFTSSKLTHNFSVSFEYNMSQVWFVLPTELGIVEVYYMFVLFTR